MFPIESHLGIEEQLRMKKEKGEWTVDFFTKGRISQ